MKMRKYRSSDLQSILDVNMLAFAPIHESFEQILGENIFSLVYPDWRASNAEYIKSLVNSDDIKNVYVAESHDRIIGFIHFTINKEKLSGEIGLNAIHPDEQGNGYGKQMYEFALRIMKEEGIKLVCVGTGGDDSHIPACKAYESCGFKRLPLARYFLAL